METTIPELEYAQKLLNGVKRKMETLHPHFSEKYQFRIVKIKGKSRKNCWTAKAFQLGIPLQTLRRAMKENSTARRPEILELMAKATKTPLKLWSKGGDLEARKAAVEAWWEGLKKANLRRICDHKSGKYCGPSGNSKGRNQGQGG
jgi:hypothetical protein